MKKKCQVCEIIFDIKPSHYDLRKTCSRVCCSVLRKSRVAADPQEKTCSLCQGLKQSDDFRKKGGGVGLSSWCKKCADKKRSEYVQKKPEHYKQKSREYYLKNKQEGRISVNKVKKALADKKYREKNKEKLKIKLLRRKKNRRKTDLKFVLNERVSHAIWKALAGNKAGRHWEQLVGYSLENLISRLKKTIPKGYVFNDYLSGKLQIDHIIPKSVFNYRRPEDLDFKRCWALSNLQLLTVEENSDKGAKIKKPFQPCLMLTTT